MSKARMADRGTAHAHVSTVNALFFGLAFTAALNPKLLAMDLLLIENRRPRAMFVSILAGGIGVGVTIGLIDVLVVRADAVKSQGKVSAGVDLALGVFLLIFGVLLVTGVLGRLVAARRSSHPRPDKKQGKSKDSLVQRALREPRLGLALVIGVVCGLPGAAYITGLHNLIAGKYSTATQVVAVILFVIIEFLLIIVPWLCLELRPEATVAGLKRAQGWLTGHVTQLVSWICILLATYLVISALVRLL
jgi:hypothetical protein